MTFSWKVPKKIGQMGVGSRFFGKKIKKKGSKSKLRRSKMCFKWPNKPYVATKMCIFWKKNQLGHFRGQYNPIWLIKCQKLGISSHWFGLVWWKPLKWNQHTQKPSNGPLTHSYGSKIGYKMGFLAIFWFGFAKTSKMKSSYPKT